jgi:uncharacterized protein (TIGR03067 family)
MKIQRSLVLVAAILAGLVLAAGSVVDAGAQTAGTLDGTWVAVSAERNGKPADELKGHRLTFRGDTFVIEREGKTLYKGTFKTDSAKKPAQIDFRNTEGEAKAQTWRGIYRLEGEALTTVDNAPDTKKPRPVRFTTTPDSGHVMLTFRRAP